MKTNNTLQSQSYDIRKITSALILVVAFCFAGQLTAADIHIGRAIYNAASQIPFDQEAFNEELANLNANINSQDTHENGGNTALHWAIHKNDEKTIKTLLRQKGINLELTNRHGATPLMLAMTQNPHIVDLLIKQGANVNTSSPTNGETALHYAASNTNTIRTAYGLIANNANINSRDAWGNTPLHSAAINSNIGICMLLIAEGADRNAVNRLGKTPLDRAHHKLESLQQEGLSPQSQKIQDAKKVIELLTPPATPSFLQTLSEGLDYFM